MGQDLRHLSDVAELVGQVSHHERTAQRSRPGEPSLEVAEVRLARDEELVHLGHPRTHGQPSVLGQTPDVGFALRANGEVVVDHRGLSVEVEVREPGVPQLDQRVHHRHQARSELVERGVPLAVPMRVGDERDPGGVHGARVSHGAGPRGPQSSRDPPRRLNLAMSLTRLDLVCGATTGH